MEWPDVVFPSLIVCGLFGVMLVVGIGFACLWLVWLNKRLTKCPECGETGAGERVESKVIDSSAHLEWKTRSSTFLQNAGPVRVTEKTYEDHFKCRYCGHQWTETTQEKMRGPL